MFWWEVVKQQSHLIAVISTSVDVLELCLSSHVIYMIILIVHAQLLRLHTHSIFKTSSSKHFPSNHLEMLKNVTQVLQANFLSQQTTANQAFHSVNTASARANLRRTSPNGHANPDK